MTGIGIIGANPDAGWSFTSHVPAIQATDGLHVAAVSTTREDSARRAAALLPGASWHTDAASLAADPAVDLVLVSVKVPHHAELVEAAAAAGKAVISEWPLALDTAQARHLVDVVDRAGVPGLVVLQGRHDEVLRRVRDLLASSGLGPVSSVTAHSSRAKDRAVPARIAYTLEQGSGAGTLEIAGGHLLDQLDHLLGGLTVVTGAVANVITDHVVAETDEPLVATAPDVVTASWRLRDGGLGTTTIWDGDPAATTRIHVAGALGSVTLESVDPGDSRLRQPQMASYRAHVVTADLDEWWEPTPSDLPQGARHMVGVWADVAADLVDGGRRTPRFDDAVDLHEKLDVVRAGRASA